MKFILLFQLLLFYSCIDNESSTQNNQLINDSTEIELINVPPTELLTEPPSKKIRFQKFHNSITIDSINIPDKYNRIHFVWNLGEIPFFNISHSNSMFTKLVLDSNLNEYFKPNNNETVYQITKDGIITKLSSNDTIYFKIYNPNLISNRKIYFSNNLKINTMHLPIGVDSNFYFLPSDSFENPYAFIFMNDTSYKVHFSKFINQSKLMFWFKRKFTDDGFKYFEEGQIQRLKNNIVFNFRQDIVIYNTSNMTSNIFKNHGYFYYVDNDLLFMANKVLKYKPVINTLDSIGFVDSEYFSNGILGKVGKYYLGKKVIWEQNGYENYFEYFLFDFSGAKIKIMQTPENWNYSKLIGSNLYVIFHDDDYKAKTIYKIQLNVF